MSIVFSIIQDAVIEEDAVDQDGRASFVPNGSPGLLLDPPSSSMNVDQDCRASPGSPGLLCPGQAMLAGDTVITPPPPEVEEVEPVIIKQDVDIARKLLRHGHSPYANRTTTSYGSGVSLNTMDSMLEKETNRNKTDSWNRLDKTIKLRKLNAYAEIYGREHALSSKDVKLMQSFFIESLEKNKLQRTKEVIYDKDTHEIRSIPALHYNAINRHFTLRITDTKRVSTLKSLTPLKREKKEPTEDINIDMV